MRILPSVAFLSLSVSIALGLAACGGSSGGPASVSGVFPDSAYLGRTLDVTLSGSSTSWSASTTASFGDGITVNKLTVASPSAIVANITVANTAATGARDITVKDGSSSEPYKMAFSVSPSISVTTMGTPAQGSILFATIKTNDVTHTFDTTSTGDGFTSPIVYTNIAITKPTGVSITVTNVTDFEVDATILVDTSAAAGNLDIDLQSGPAGNTEEFFYPAAVAVTAQTAAALTDSATVSLAADYSSKLFKYTPKAAGDLVVFGATAGGQTATANVIVLDKTGSFANLLGSGATFAYLPANTDPVYVIIWDAGGTGTDTATTDVEDLTLAVQSGGEGTDATNDVSTGATVLSTPPVIVKSATLFSDTDQDWYAVTVPAGKAIHVRTLDGDQGVDTAVSFWAADGVTPLDDPDYNDGVVDNDSNDLGEDTITDVVPSAGTYLIQIIPGQGYDPSATTYNLVVTLE